MVALSLATAALLISVMALGISSWALIELMAMKKSTHQIQMVDPSTNIPANKELEKFMTPPDQEEMFV